MIQLSDITPHIKALKKTITERSTITDADLLLLLPYLQIKQWAKNDLLVAQGEIENRVHFIIEGISRSFFFKDDTEISFEFHFQGSFISAYESFLTRTPSQHSVEAFTPLTVLSINHTDLMLVFEQSAKLAQIKLLFTEELFIKTSERVKDLLSLSATERYLKLLNAYPQYVQQIPLKYLASYLHLTPESLSRIRKKL
jgi:CRP-like cAMP-binding protein